MHACIRTHAHSRYDLTNGVPREVLASVVDDFNSGDPELVRAGKARTIHWNFYALDVGYHAWDGVGLNENYLCGNLVIRRSCQSVIVFLSDISFIHTPTTYHHD